METIPESPKLELEQETLGYLGTARKWSMFLARMGFIFLALLIILGIFTGTFLRVFNSGAEGIGIPGLFIIVLLLILGIFFVLPVYHLYNFSKYMNAAIRLNNGTYLKKAFKNLKSHFVYLGIFVIVVVTIYIVIIGVGGALMAFLKIL